MSHTNAILDDRHVEVNPNIEWAQFTQKLDQVRHRRGILASSSFDVCYEKSSTPWQIYEELLSVKNFRQFAKICLGIVSLPASSAGVERSFSAEDRLKPEKVDKLLLVYFNKQLDSD